MTQMQVVLVGAFCATAGLVALLAAKGVMPGPAQVVDRWCATWPAVPRRWLAAAFWSNLALPATACGIIVATAGQALSSAWNDVGQSLIWSSMAVDAAMSGRRSWLAISVAFTAFSVYGAVQHLL